MSDSEDIAKIRVTIMGREYTLRGDLNPEYMETLAKRVNDKIEDLRSVASGVDALQLAILAALNFADEAEQLTGGQSPTELGDIEEKTRRLISMLEKGIVGDV
ncbi:MAG: cell division protein ZapA [Leptospirales bacterium]